MTITLKTKPNPIEIDPKTTAVIVIDMQRDFLEEGGYGSYLGNDVSILRSSIKPIKDVLSIARQKKMLVIHTREGHLPDLSDCPRTKLERWPEGHRIGDPGPMGRILIRGEEGHQIIPELEPLPDEKVIDKPGKNAFYKTDLDNYLAQNNIRTLLVMGVTTDICGASTVASLNDYGYDPIVVEDCMASYAQNRHDAALDIMTAQGGIWGWTIKSKEVVEKLSGYYG